MKVWFGEPQGDLVEEARQVEMYAFAEHRWPGSLPEYIMDDIGYRRVLCVGGEVVASCRVIPFTARLHGHKIRASGLSSVASPPEHRRRGYMRQLLKRTLAEEKEAGHALSLLWPFKYSFYQKMGWDQGGQSLRLVIPISALSVVDKPESGRYLRVGPEEYHRLEPLYGKWAQAQPLAVDRWKEWWQQAVFRFFEDHCRAVIWEVQGSVRGYMFYRISRDAQGGTIRIVQLAALDPEAWRALWRYVYDHEAQVRFASYITTPDDPLIGYLPDALDSQDNRSVPLPGFMARALDTTALLEDLPLRGKVQGEMVLEITDPLGDQDHHCLKVVLQGGRLQIKPYRAEPEVVMGPGALAQVILGYPGVKILKWLGKVKGDPGKLSLLEEAYPPTAPILREMF